MMHQFRDKRKINQRKKIIKNIIIFCVFLLFSVSGFFGWFGKIFEYIGKPIWEAKENISEGINNSSDLVRTKESVFKENNNLLKENSELRISMIDYQNLKDENEKLKEMLGRLPTKSELILASILAKPNQSPYDTIIIDVGNDLGIQEQQKVYANGTIPIGRISKVYDKTSLVTLYSNPGQKTEGILEGSNATVELVGRGGSNFEMLIPIDLSSEEGIKVFLPNIESEVLAFVSKVISAPTDPMKRVLLSSPVNIQNLKWVEVKKN